MRGETVLRNIQRPSVCISIHSPHARGDVRGPGRRGTCGKFQSTPLMRGETLICAGVQPSTMYFNPLPSCEGRHIRRQPIAHTINISIHSPHARGDLLAADLCTTALTISIHSPHARGDGHLFADLARQSYFNPLPSCEGRLVKISLM